METTTTTQIIHNSTKQEYKETIKLPVWKNLVEEIINNPNSWNYGSIHSHEEIGDILDTPYIHGDTNHQYRDNVRRANKELLSMGKGIKNVYGVGFEVVTPGEYYKWARKHEKKSWKQLKNAIRIIDSAPVDKMSRPDLTVHLKTRDHLSRISVIVEEERKDYAAELRAAKREIELLRGENR